MGSLNRMPPRGLPEKTNPVAKWMTVVLIALGVGYGIFQFGLPGARPTASIYAASDIREVDFSGLAESQKKKVMGKANRDGCGCGCNMTLAQCIVIDRACPLWQSHITQLQAMVRQKAA